ncbi:formylglycine-generating enzyme family protein [Candidatus Dependentiae bacterium]|nr:formylglycine-generating enzyme family protein [Candidatus Dependentiae bacterium]
MNSKFNVFLSDYLRHRGIGKLKKTSDLFPINNKKEINIFLDNIASFIYRNDITFSEIIEAESCIKELEANNADLKNNNEYKIKFIELKNFIYKFRRNNMVFVPNSQVTLCDKKENRGCQQSYNVFIKNFYIDSMPVNVKSFIELCPEFAANISEYKFFDEPVRGITWNQAAIYSKKIGKRLPSEFEWYYASAGPEQNKYFSGKKLTGCIFNQPKNWIYHRLNTTTYKNFFNIYYMTGLIWEWTDNWYLPYPKNFKSIKKSGYKCKVTKGGCWSSPESECDNNFRNPVDPNISDNRIGFRCAIDV